MSADDELIDRIRATIAEIREAEPLPPKVILPVGVTVDDLIAATGIPADLLGPPPPE